MAGHHPSCRADYPEKPEGEAPQSVTRVDDGEEWWESCNDCGAVLASGTLARSE